MGGIQAEKKTKAKPIIPLHELKCVNYYQFRIDKLPKGCVEPRIHVGLCRDDFGIEEELSLKQDVWCMNLATGDKYAH